MKTWKQALALVLALVMALSLVALPSFAAGEEDSGGTESTQPVWPAEGSINLSKKAQPVDEESGLYEVTLGIQGKNYKTTSDVVLVIDCSGSMSGTKLQATRTAAKAFGDKLLTENSSTRIAIVTFIDEATAYNNGHFYMASELSDFKNAVDKATYAKGGTNQQAGIHKAQELLAASTGRQKNIVILSDGEATFCYEVTALNENNVELGYTLSEETNCGYGNDHRTPTIKLVASGVKDDTALTIKRCNYNTPIGSGGSFDLPDSWPNDQTYSLSVNGYFNHPEVTGTYRCKHTYSSYRKTWNYTIDANNSNGQSDSTVHITGYKDDTTTFSTKGSTTLDVTNCGQSTIWEANTAKKAGTTIFSVALQAGTNGENTLKSCATDAAKGYFSIGQDDNVEQKLTSAFEAIAGSIAIAASNGSVTDPMSQYVNLAFTGDPKVTNSLDEYNAGGYDVYLSQGTVTRNGETLNWNVGDINEGTPAVMKYRVRLNDNVKSGKTYPTNDTTTFNYTDYQGRETSKDFDIPQVAPKGGTILMHFYLVNAQGRPINEKGVEVESPDKAKQLAAQEYYQMSGSQALEYGTYSVPMRDISGAAYYGYTLDGDTTKDVTAAPVTVSATNANREVWFAYTQSFYVAHVRMNADGNAETVYTDTYPVSASFDLTEKVNKKADGSAVTEGNYLYGGAFNNPACTTPYPFTGEGETGLSFVPQAGATYYIWEVPDAYLKPVTLSCWEHNTNGKLDVIGFYMVSGIDREYYKQVGFMLNGAKTVADQRTLTYQDNTTKVTQLTSGQSAAFEQIVLKQKDGNTRTYNVSNAVKGYDKGYMVCYGVEQEVWKDVNAENTYSPYWITLDGVKVTSATARTVEYQGEGSSRLNYSEKSDKVGYEAASVSAETQLLTLASYCADGTPITADVPTVENVTVTVVDADKTYELTVSAGTGVRDQVAYQAPAGKIFAGWFADQAYTTPADLDQITEDTTIYAKYVSDSYLDLDYSRTGLFRLRGVTLISAVDNPANYQASGFIVGDQKVDVSYASRYRIFKTPANLFGAARDAKLMLADKSLSGTGTLEVTPYWVTLDGTEVHGVTHTLHYNTRTIWE